ncbi:hypothetical protein N9L18_00470 [Candidatus Pacebacteria bacterium]|nr:hypothetical protein [Candidatus Paceibacterota bacterium]
MKSLIKVFLIIAIFAVGFVAYAQENNEDVIDSEMNASTTSESDMDDMTEEDMSDETQTNEEYDEYTEEELEEIIDSAEEITEEEIEDSTDLEGEVVAVTDDTVLIETPEGDVISVSKSLFESHIAKREEDEKRQGGRRRDAAPGQKIESGKVDSSGNTVSIVTSSGKYSVNNSTSVTRNGEESSIEEMEEGDEIVAIFDKNGNLIAVDLLSDIEEASNIMLFGTIIVIIVILLLALMMRGKGKGKKLEETV